MADELKYKAYIKKPIQTPNANGGFDTTYETVGDFWCSIENENSYIKAVRGEQIQAGVTHVLKVRWVAVKNLGKEFTDAFDSSFDSIRDVNMLKSNYFIFIQETVSYRGRMFRIEGMIRDEKFREWARMQVHEIFEVGAGAVE